MNKVIITILFFITLSALFGVLPDDCRNLGFYSSANVITNDNEENKLINVNIGKIF